MAGMVAPLWAGLAMRVTLPDRASMSGGGAGEAGGGTGHGTGTVVVGAARWGATPSPTAPVPDAAAAAARALCCGAGGGTTRLLLTAVSCQSCG